MKDLGEVFKVSKNNKARDAHGHTYEVFKFCGGDLKKSLLELFNLVKNKQIYPTIFQPANITSLYKKRGDKSDLNSDRGIFNVVKIKSILERLVYNEKYPVLDSNMSCSNIGARKGRNIRDHLFVLNAILHDVAKDKNRNIDLEIYDIMKCFDKMWAAETANDIYRAGLNDDKFVLIANSNQKCQVAVKTPWGSLTERKVMTNIEMQGGVLTPLKCSIQMDTLGKEMLENSELARTMFKYKDCVHIPVLTFIDDAISVTECGPNSVKMNAYMQSKVDTKKLELGETKCFKIHIGNKKCSCPVLKIHNKEMLSSTKEKYLGDLITSDTKIDENIKMRHDKGLGIANQILSILKEVSFGIFHFEMGLLFRTSLLLNGILFNTEVLFSMTEKHVKSLEECDKYLMRSLFNAEIGTPIEALFIETSATPLRFVLKGRQIMYYWTLLRKSESELVKRVFSALKQFSTKNDWYQQVRAEMTECGINCSDEEIAAMSKYKFKKLVDKKIKEKSSQYLMEMQVKHKKSKLLHQSSDMKEYLTCENLSIREKQLLFKLRTMTTPNKTNFKGKYLNDISCSLCKDANSEENLQHLLNCSYLLRDADLRKESKTIKLEHIFGNLDQQVKAVKIWSKIFKIYEKHNKQQ